MGSVYGCTWGSSCQPKPPPVPPQDHNDTSGCHLAETCSECATKSHLCHWCGHDNRCHVVGSVYGCVTGVDCYSNDRCMRRSPEPIDHLVFTKISAVPLFVIVSISLSIFLCSSFCCCLAGGIKGAYDDLADLAADATPIPPALLPRAAAPSAVAAAAATVVPATQNSNSNQDELGEGRQHGETTSPGTGSDPDENDEVHLNETSALVNSSQDSDRPMNGDEYVRLVEGSDDEDDEYYRSRHRNNPPVHMKRMYNACVGCYLVTVVVTGFFCFTAIRMFPKIPEYNICNDALAWKSVIDSITSMKVTTDIEILASVSNPNHFAVALDMGRGSFTHNQAFVGTFDIPPVTIEAMSVTDFLIIAHISPQTWDALSLTEDYYQGKLVLDVDAQAEIRIPAFRDYTYAANLKDIIVHVNQLSDRHLCACPTWSDTKNGTVAVATGEISNAAAATARETATVLNELAANA